MFLMFGLYKKKMFLLYKQNIFFLYKKKMIFLYNKRITVEHDLLVLLNLLHDRMFKEGAHILHDLVQRAEQRGVVSADEFREGILDFLDLYSDVF